MIGLKDQCFGVEVEMTGITREQAGRIFWDGAPLYWRHLWYLVCEGS